MLYFKALLGLILFSATSLAFEIRVATLNACKLFDPGIESRRNHHLTDQLTHEDFSHKIENLDTLIRQFEVIGLQDIGGQQELETLSKSGGFQLAFAPGKEVYGQGEVGLLFKLFDWNVVTNGRVPELDSALPKHLLVTATKGNEVIRFLVVHLVRPSGTPEGIHQASLLAISSWIKKELELNPKCSIAVLGDFSISKVFPGSSLLGLGLEAGEKIGFSPTHISGKPFDRMIVAGKGAWTRAEVIRPEYGGVPTQNRWRLSTDHYLLGATLNGE